MRVQKRAIDGRTGKGIVKLICDEAEDMYHLYNLVTAGDVVTASTVRAVVKESKTGSVDKARMRMQLRVRVEKIEFDAEQCSLRLCGRNVEENEYVKMGQYHTLDLELNFPFTVEKECWDPVYLDTLKAACDPGAKADVAAVVMQEGLAHVCLITSSLTITRARLERPMPKKKAGDKSFEKAMARFFADILEAMRKHINFEVVKAVLIGSPGFLKDDFVKFMMETATRQGDATMLKQRSKIVKTHATSGHKKAIDDLLGNPELKGQLLDVRAAGEVQALRDFCSTLANDEQRAAYGFKQVQYAHDNLAIAQLLITDRLFKSADFQARKSYVALAESVKASGGLVLVFSSMHVSGEQLDSFTGIAATLRFPLPESASGEDGLGGGAARSPQSGGARIFESDSEDEGADEDNDEDEEEEDGVFEEDGYAERRATTQEVDSTIFDFA